MADPNQIDPYTGKSLKDKLLHYIMNDSIPAKMVQGAWSGVTLPGDVYAGRVDPLSDEGIRRAADLAGTVTLGSGAMPARGVEFRAGVGLHRNQGQMMSSDIGSIDDLRKAFHDDSPVYVRWSRGPDFDMKPGAKSRDYQTGEVHSGLSAVDITSDMSEAQMLRMIADYGHLRSADAAVRPYFYRGKEVGLDSDGGPSIRPTEYVGGVSDDFLRFVSDDTAPERIGLMGMIDNNRKALELYAKEPPKFIPPYSEKTLAEYERRLGELGGPVDPMFLYGPQK